nr:hypothetical protein CFP56_43751 [Quercus suber]
MGEDGVVAPGDVRGLLGVETVRRVVVTEQTLLRALLPYALCVYCATVMDDARVPVNRAAAKLVAGRSKYRWRGSMVVMMGTLDAFQPGTSAVGEVGDVDLNHLPDLVAFLLDKQGQDPAHMARTRHGREYSKVTACRIACLGRERDSGGDLIEVVEVPPAHYMFETEDNISPLSKLIGMPLHMIKYSSSKPYQGNDLNNIAAKHMQNTIRSSSFKISNEGYPNFGDPPKEWLGGPGDVLVARQDREPLNPETLGIFSYFCCFHFDAWYQWGWVLANCGTSSQEVLPEEEIKRVILHHFSPEKWKDYVFAWTSVDRAKDALDRMPSGKTEEEFAAVVEEFAAFALDPCSRDRLIKDLNSRTWEPTVDL